ncbi:DASS family sodium-coupled anion symporter [Oribacterium sp. C9]|uniref:DASS family sodium-coupled anion symporter n=1 Tax=Oribacterium sp. C9 TaxID=1943579 RepID=UPI00099028C6|nr:DASS family sodium-coupled anion symporter [Oribacterium sp. C9]
MKEKILKMIPIVLVPLLIFLLPTPVGLETEVWHLFGLTISLLFGLVLKPFPEPVISLIVIGIGSFFVADPSSLYTGYAKLSVWFLLAVLLAFGAFKKTGLGQRMAYVLLRKFNQTKLGQTSLGLGYIMMICDLILSPATGSNTSRSAIIFPIFRGVAESFGSYPDRDQKKLGAYLELLEHVVAMSTAVLFLTGMASNAVIASTIKDVTGIELSWGLWFKAALVPGLIVLFVCPLLVYKLFAPEMKNFGDIRPLVDAKLEEMGEMKKDEKLLFFMFILAILGWVVGPKFGINMNVVAFGLLALELLTGIITWDDMMKDRTAWNMYLWSGAFFSLSNAINAGGFYTWLSGRIQSVLDLSALNGMVVLIVLLLLSFSVKYFFVSNAAYIASIYPIILTLGLTTRVNLMMLSLMMAFFGGYGALVCNYGNGASIYLYGNGYVTQKDWYVKGTIMLFMIFGVFLLIGIPYWKLTGIC